MFIYIDFAVFVIVVIAFCLLFVVVVVVTAIFVLYTSTREHSLSLILFGN